MSDKFDFLRDTRTESQKRSDRIFGSCVFAALVAIFFLGIWKAGELFILLYEGISNV